MGKKKIILDTNGLMIPGQFGVEILSELERLGFDSLIVPKPVVLELEKLSIEARGLDRRAARIALSLLDDKRFEILEAEGKVDDLIVDLAVELGAAVLTNDIELKKRLCSKNVSVVYLRGKNHLSI